jgi:hypothetical protein
MNRLNSIGGSNLPHYDKLMRRQESEEITEETDQGKDLAELS